MRDAQLPLVRRYAALRCAVGRYCPLRFHATWAYLAATACPFPDLRGDPAALLRALETLEASRALRLDEAGAFAARRRAEKAATAWTPRRVDEAHAPGPRRPSLTGPSRLGLVAAVANRHTAFRRSPFPDERFCRDDRVRQLTDLHARLDDCATSYLTNLGHMDAWTRDALAETITGIERLARTSTAPLHGDLLPWLRFANLIAHATAVPLDR
ncbi:hypothetical protein ACQ4WX_30345 [Streptomyces lasalocidi]